MGQTVAILNQKGGVGKTTVTMGLASAAMAKGHKILVVDLDPQGASSWMLGVDASTSEHSVADVLTSPRGGSAKGCIRPSQWSHLVDVLPSAPDLQNLEVLKAGLESVLLGNKAQNRLRKGLHKITDGYAAVLIDCPPSLGSLTTNGLAAAHQALMVVEPTALSLRGLGPAADLIDEVWSSHNRDLELAGVIVNRMPPRSHDADVRYDELERSVGKKSVWKPEIPHRVVLAEAAAAQKPIHAMGARGREVAEIFDRLYGKLWRIIKPGRAEN